MNIAPKMSSWQPPDSISREDMLARSDAVLAKPSLPLRQAEDIFRIQALGLDWDMGVTVYEPADPAQIARGADGKKIGIFLLHGGSGDYKSMEPIAKLFAEKFGCKAVAMTFPGRLYLDDPSRDWPDDTIHPDGTVRTPIWLTGEHITPDQYEVVRDTTMRLRYGTRTVARAKPGTHLLRPHGGVAGRVRGGHEGRDAPAFPGRRLLDLPHRPFDRRPDGVLHLAACAQRRRHDRGRELAVRLHPGGAAQLVGRARQGRGLRARDQEEGAAHRSRSTSSTSAPGATARAMPARRRSARKGRRR